jgi:MFS family permease
MQNNEVNARSIAAATGAWLGLLFGANAMISATNSNFMKPLAAAFGVDRTMISAALSVAPLIVAFAVPAGGWAMDRFGLRRVVIPGALLFALVIIALSRVTTVWQFALLQIPIGIASSMHCSVGYAKVVTLWFDRWRGLVLGLIVALGAGVGQTAMPMLSQWLISRFGWQNAYVAIGLIVLCIGLPAIALLVREPVQSAARPPGAPSLADVPEGKGVGITVQEALRQRNFWLIVGGILFGSMTLLGTLQHGVPIMTEHGFPIDNATRAMSFAFAGVVAGQLTSGMLVNQINTPKIIVPYFVAALIGLLIVHSVHVESGVALLYAGALMLGLGLGGEVAQNAYLVSRYFGLKSFGSIYGLTFAASNIGIAIGTLALGKMHDLAHSYAPMRLIFGIGMGVSVLCIASLGPYIYARKSAR